ncbi:hypothetical protein [uncultured Dialister sp.]|uniref:hypothetical protein n=1 Tax=uncultured Dialister sp. TaxID=278064 RepID=UPI00259620D8|nr:hypothetical protein [uncultured Dialister sp.]
MSGDIVKRVQAVRKWLEKAEHSYSSHKEITGEINLIMAQAEMQRLNETHKNSKVRRWMLRISAMGAAFAVFLGMNAFWSLMEPKAEEPERPVQIVIHDAPSPVGEKTETAVSQGEDKSLAEAVPPSAEDIAPAAAPSYIAPAEAPAPAPAMEAPVVRTAPAPRAAPALSDKEIQSVVGEAGRALRGQS